MSIFNKLQEFMPWYWVNNNIHISLKHKYVYFETPKVACSSIKKTLIKHETGTLFDRYDLPIHAAPFSSVWVKPYQLTESTLQSIFTDKAFFKFTFVRDPYTRILSSYLDKIALKKSGYPEVLAKIPGRKNGDDIGFNEFLQVMSTTSPAQMNSHFRPLHYQLFGNELNLDFVGHFENFDEEFSQLLQNLGLGGDSAISFREHKTDANSQLERYYTHSEYDLVNTIYQCDFKRFGYPMR